MGIEEIEINNMNRTRRCTLTSRGVGLLPIAPFVFPVVVAKF